MSRADIINGLGIGHLSHRALVASRRLFSSNGESGASERIEEGYDDGTAATSGEEESVGDFSESSQAVDVDDDDTDVQDGDPSGGLPCRSLDIGGFYSALCSLGTRVTVGTKVRCTHFLLMRILPLSPVIHSSCNTLYSVQV